jgi:hypothetical protein
MRETWLETNRRALWFGTLPPLAFIALGAWMTWNFTTPGMFWLNWLGIAMIVVGSCLTAAMLSHMRRPRISYEEGEVFFNLRIGSPIPVPVELEEAFFIGQGPLMIAGAPQHDVSVNLVARISQRDPSYVRREVKPALGAWCDGYVTIRGTWCEPLTGEVVRRLNHRLREVSEERANSSKQIHS